MPDKHRQLYDQLKSDGFYTKSYDEFVKQFSNPDKIAKLHNMLQADGMYTQSADNFKNQFFKGIQAPDTNDYTVIPVKDTRTIDSVTQKGVDDKSRLHVNIDSAQARKIVSKAKQYGIDPYTALAIAYQETGFKSDYADNPFNLQSGDRYNPDTIKGDRIDQTMQTILDKNKIAESLGKTSDEEKIQAWNGYGKIGGGSFGGKVQKVYGLDVTKNPIDMNTDPVYGKRVVDIRDNILKTNPEIVKLVDEVGQKE